MNIIAGVRDCEKYSPVSGSIPRLALAVRGDDTTLGVHQPLGEAVVELRATDDGSLALAIPYGLHSEVQCYGAGAACSVDRDGRAAEVKMV